MNIDKAEKKVREAEFFLGKMREEERDAFGGNQEPFEFYLSAFLSAAATVRDCFRHGQGRASRFKQDWVGQLKSEQKSLYNRLGKERDAEVHRAASSRKAKTEKKEFGPGTYSFGGATHHVFAPPDVQAALILQKQVYTFTIAGTEYIAIDACAEYCELLAQMVVDYKVLTQP
jgi:hypothetical protein